LKGRRGRWRELPGTLWSRRTWLFVAHLLTGGVLWLVPVSLVAVIVGIGVMKRLPLGGLQIAGSAKPVRMVVGLVGFVLALFALVALVSRLTAWQRTRFHLILGEDLLPFASTYRDRPWWRGVARRAVDRRAWRQLRYHLIGGALNATAAAAFLACLLLGVGLPVTAASLGAMTIPPRLGLVAIGVAALLSAPWLVRGATSLDLALARALLQPSAAEAALARRVKSLSASRAGAIDAADAERRRIERDLHDGTQQRLVSLAMNLGMTRAALRDADPEVRQAVADAHEQAKQALAELRDFIRGLHPGGPRRPRPRCGAVGHRGPVAGTGPAHRRIACPAAGRRGGGGVLRGVRGAEQRGPARRGEPSGRDGAAAGR
jgi:hypothetical protein